MATTGRERTQINFYEGRADTASEARLGRWPVLATCIIVFRAINLRSCRSPDRICIDRYGLPSDPLRSTRGNSRPPARGSGHHRRSNDAGQIRENKMLVRHGCKFSIPMILQPVPSLAPRFCHCGANIQDSVLVLTRCANLCIRGGFLDIY